MKYQTIRDATCGWVNEFSAFPIGMIERLFLRDDDCEWSEITLPSYGDRVSLIEMPEGSVTYDGEITDYFADTNTYEVKMDDDAIVTIAEEDIESVERNDALPMWGTMWQFKEMLDDDWIERDGLRALSDCGFRVYHHEEFGYFFGIDGAGYDFYDAHWIPLYKRRGLKWHEKEE